MQHIESYFHVGSGYEPFLIRDGWQVAQLNYAPELSMPYMRRVERHKATDEVFILVRGRSILFAAAKDGDGLTFEIIRMRPGVTYNVPTGVWHGIAMNPEDLVLIVEKSRTHLGDVEYRELSQREYDELQSMLHERSIARERDEPA